MSSQQMQCAYCGNEIPAGVTICPACHEDLSGLARLEFQPVIYYNQALSLAREGRLDEARDKLIVSTTLDDTFGPAYVLLAKVYARQENWPRANEASVRALQLMPEDEKVRELATHIDQLASEAQRATQRRERRLSEAAARPALPTVTQAPMTHERELASAFGLGLLAAVLLGAIWRWITGGDKEA